jgi:hypothetical protein
MKLCSITNKFDNTNNNIIVASPDCTIDKLLIFTNLSMDNFEVSIIIIFIIIIIMHYYYYYYYYYY